MIIITAALSHLQTRKRTRQRSARAQYASDCTRLCCDAPAAMGRAYNRAALVCCGSGAFSKARRKQSSAWICLSTVDAARMGACISVPMGRSGLPGLLQGRHIALPLVSPGARRAALRCCAPPRKASKTAGLVHRSAHRSAARCLGLSFLSAFSAPLKSARR